jgi:hypothetical protein
VLTLDGMETGVDFNILLLGSYDILKGMDWIEKNAVVVNCKNKTLDCLDEVGHNRTIKGIPCGVSVRQISSLQLKQNAIKGCEIYVVHINEGLEKRVDRLLTDDPILSKFQDVFPEDIQRLPPRRDIDFTTYLVPGSSLVSKAPYRMSVPELSEYKMHLQELLDKQYIRPSVSPWGALVLFVKNKDNILGCALTIDN